MKWRDYGIIVVIDGFLVIITYMYTCIILQKKERIFTENIFTEYYACIQQISKYNMFVCDAHDVVQLWCAYPAVELYSTNFYIYRPLPKFYLKKTID